ncbi:hypothetical protein MAUB1S_00131 [Mycolicibacterium aubagnense]
MKRHPRVGLPEVSADKFLPTTTQSGWWVLRHIMGQGPGNITATQTLLS